MAKKGPMSSTHNTQVKQGFEPLKGICTQEPATSKKPTWLQETCVLHLWMDKIAKSICTRRQVPLSPSPEVLRKQRNSPIRQKLTPSHQYTTQNPHSQVPPYKRASTTRPFNSLTIPQRSKFCSETNQVSQSGKIQVFLIKRRWG